MSHPELKNVEVPGVVDPDNPPTNIEEFITKVRTDFVDLDITEKMVPAAIEEGTYVLSLKDKPEAIQAEAERLDKESNPYAAADRERNRIPVTESIQEQPVHLQLLTIAATRGRRRFAQEAITHGAGDATSDIVRVATRSVGQAVLYFSKPA